MRVLTCGFEVYDSVAAVGLPGAENWGPLLTRCSYSNSVVRTVAGQHGDYSLHVGDGSSFDDTFSQPWKTGATEIYFRFGYRLAVVAVPLVARMLSWWDDYGDRLGEIDFEMNFRRLQIWIGTTALELQASSSRAFTPDQWYRVEVYVKIHATLGQVIVKVDDEVWVSWTGDTKSASVNGLVQAMGFMDCKEFYLDDIAVNNTWAVLYYDGGSGSAPVLGEVVTGAGGASGTIKEITGDATSGWLALEMTDGTNFVNNEVITAPGGLNAFANGAENRDNCSWCGEGVVKVSEASADGSTLQLECSSGSDHYALVNAPQTTKYVYDSVADQYDTYEFEDLPVDVTGLRSVATLIRVGRNNTSLKNVQAVARPLTTDFFSQDGVAGTDYGWKQFQWHSNPETLASWTPGEFDDSEFGVRVRA